MLRALDGRAQAEFVHNGQHYGARMSERFSRDLGIAEPDVDLGVGCGTPTELAAAIMVGFERYPMAREADAVAVGPRRRIDRVAAIRAVKLHIPVAHVAAGLRSRDWTMPAEINRVLTDRISRWLLTTSADANHNLAAEGTPAEWAHRIGNVMIDTLLANPKRAQ